MPEYYTNTQPQKSKKKFIIIALAVLAIMIVAGVIAVNANRANQLTKEEASAYALIFKDQIRARRYNNAYDMVQNHQLTKQEFDEYMINANKTNKFGACRVDNSANVSVVTMRCPYKSTDTTKTLTISFKVVKQDNKVAIESYSISD